MTTNPEISFNTCHKPQRHEIEEDSSATVASHRIHGRQTTNIILPLSREDLKDEVEKVKKLFLQFQSTVPLEEKGQQLDALEKPVLSLKASIIHQRSSTLSDSESTTRDETAALLQESSSIVNVIVKEVRDVTTSITSSYEECEIASEKARWIGKSLSWLAHVSDEGTERFRYLWDLSTFHIIHNDVQSSIATLLEAKSSFPFDFHEDFYYFRREHSVDHLSVARFQLMHWPKEEDTVLFSNSRAAHKKIFDIFREVNNDVEKLAHEITQTPSLLKKIELLSLLKKKDEFLQTAPLPSPSDNEVDKRCELIAELVATIRDTHATVKKEVFRIVQNLHTTPSPEQKLWIENGYRWLSSDSRTTKVTYLWFLASFYLSQGDVESCGKVLCEIAPSFPDSVRTHFDEVSKSPTKERMWEFLCGSWTTINRHMPLSAKTASDLVQHFFDRRRMPPIAEIREIEGVLSHAVGNTIWNTELVNERDRVIQEGGIPEIKMSSAQDALLRITFTTMKFPTCQPHILQVEQELERTGLNAFLEREDRIVKSSDETRTLLHGTGEGHGGIISSLFEFHGLFHPSCDSALEDLKELSSQLWKAPNISISQKHRLMRKTLGEILQHCSLAKEKSLRVPTSEESLEEKKTNFLDLLFTTEKAVQELLDAIVQQINDEDRLVELARSSSEGNLKLQDLRALEKYAELNSWLQKFRQRGVDFSTSPMANIYRESKRALELQNSLNRLVQSLPSYGPGDLLLTDEILEKAYKDENEPIYSQLSIFHAPSIIKRTFSDTFRIQPYFTGSKTHTALTQIKSGKISKVEVLGGFVVQPPTFNDTIINVSYRPHFVSQLTEEGKDALRELWGELSEDTLDSKLRQLYQTCEEVYFDENGPQYPSLKLLRNDGVRASLAYIEDLVSFLPRSWAQSLVQQVKATIERMGGAKAITDDSTTTIFCSEFTAQLIAALQEELNSQLNEELRKKQSTSYVISFFQPVIPKNAAFKTIYPNKLESFIKKSTMYQRFIPIAPKLLMSSQSLNGLQP